MARINKNGKAYDSGDVIVNMLGNPDSEVTEITYETTQEHQRNYSLKRKARSWSMGKIENSCSITFPMEEIVAIEKAAKGNLLSIKPFDINVSFVDEYNDIINDTITCKFQTQGREVTGEMGLGKQFEMFVLDIKYNNI
ncbi:MAG: hypothetical protein N4A49_01795 [Marinifilaceae bacterium]|jgi:hypothetical protein|nr:hypothetical protein [Marinifilaceae bacterium]